MSLRPGGTLDPANIGDADVDDGALADEQLAAIAATTTRRRRRMSSISSGRARAHARANHRFDAATNIEVTDDFHPPRLGRVREIVENAIDRALVEDAVVAKAPQVELETF